jgi:diaminopimelate epimerase
MKVTTYERGAGLTYSCGTGVCSSVFIAYNIKNMKEIVKV